MMATAQAKMRLSCSAIVLMYGTSPKIELGNMIDDAEISLAFPRPQHSVAGLKLVLTSTNSSYSNTEYDSTQVPPLTLSVASAFQMSF